MGKRKPRRRAPTRAPAPKLDSEFDCPFCAALKSVQVQIKKRELIAQLHCRACNVDYQTSVGPLDEPVDVFSLWIDSCEEVNSPHKSGASLFIPQREVSRPLKEAATAPANAAHHQTKKRRLEDESALPNEEDGLPPEEEEEEFEEVVPEEEEFEEEAEEEAGDDEIEIDNYQEEETAAAPAGKRKLTKRWDADDDDD
eukprot:Gregarina_sp_Pseudo_9__5375@NODE_64_length_4638_cov_86_865188_g59_i0_p4_GENE_NODE_64_length_4638_cov_86_865188_g59_i0NODE_64_length_4638_cov_86_865188_g59_i0_p4_ORF_typecomplete_len198_score61_56Elf1/PF05129_13/7_2e25Rubredoxin/PF00301_20/1_5Rubredoxin/PF00301_20/59Dynactin_p62/PF05502_13/0_096_NODE_64_length_4638_cov_86_865188_g59_i0337930